MHRYLGRQSRSEDLRAVRLGSKAYIGLGSESAGTEARYMVTGWWLANLNEAELGYKLFLFFPSLVPGGRPQISCLALDP
jgi:hypothetical protein